MISLKSIQTSFTPTSINLFHEKEFLRKKRLKVSLCKPNDSNDSSDKESPKPEGDIQKQELLARIALLQAQKVRLTDYLDERSAYLTQFAEEANAEIDQIGENALKELDEAGFRIMENIESKMQAFEESVELNKTEVEENEKKLTDFEDKIEKDRNEGMFFKNLTQKGPFDLEKAKEEAEKIREAAKKDAAGSQVRRNIYLALIGLVVFELVEALISPTQDWRKIGILGAIMVGLVSQVFYERKVLSETKKTEGEEQEISDKNR